MPSGTGKTVTLLSLIVAYQQYYPSHRKLIYCSRASSPSTRISSGQWLIRGLGLTSRKNLCLHPSVKREKSGNVVDARCRSLTAGFIKEKKEKGEDVDVCVYHDASAHPDLLLGACTNVLPRTLTSSSLTT